MLLTVLIDEHTDGDAAHVESIQKVLDVLVGDYVLGKYLFVFYDTLGHGRHDVVVPVPDGNQGIDKPDKDRHGDIQLSGPFGSKSVSFIS